MENKISDHQAGMTIDRLSQQIVQVQDVMQVQAAMRSTYRSRHATGSSGTISSSMSSMARIVPSMALNYSTNLQPKLIDVA